jgi:hypothetical protein
VEEKNFLEIKPRVQKWIDTLVENEAMNAGIESAWKQGISDDAEPMVEWKFFGNEAASRGVKCGKREIVTMLNQWWSGRKIFFENEAAIRGVE